MKTHKGQTFTDILRRNKGRFSSLERFLQTIFKKSFWAHVRGVFFPNDLQLCPNKTGGSGNLADLEM